MSDLDETSEIYPSSLNNSGDRSNPPSCSGKPRYVVLAGPIVRFGLTCPAVIAAAGADNRNSSSTKKTSTAEFILIFDDAPLWQIIEGRRLKDPLLADDLPVENELDFTIAL